MDAGGYYLGRHIHEPEFSRALRQTYQPLVLYQSEVHVINSYRNPSLVLQPAAERFRPSGTFFGTKDCARQTDNYCEQKKSKHPFHFKPPGSYFSYTQSLTTEYAEKSSKQKKFRENRPLSSWRLLEI
jgi:hypothetical protein